ncbi:uncharacterized protein LOC142980664 [Anticarsia gemmatalis]|uniref:uncharacterized protein LOC142980664 n=1 Tax=Anticarsia gemmatalis TaxID=129554 RepID=UPI003F75D441
MFLILMSILAQVHLNWSYVISVYGDVHHDNKFFTRTFPWIIDNIGGEITVDFYLVGSGRYGVPQMCVLEMLRMNTFLQAQYLKCEAEGNLSEFCLCESGVDREKFKKCVANKGSLAGQAAAKFSQLGIEVTPIIELGSKSTVFGVEDEWYLKKICTVFGDSLPRGCVKPFACNQTMTVQASRAVAHFDSCCQNEWSQCYAEIPQPEPTTTTTLMSDYGDYTLLVN